MSGGFVRGVTRAAGMVTVAASVLAGTGCIIVVEEDRDDPDYVHWREARRAYIGVSLDTLSRETAAQLELDRDSVALIEHVYAGTPADRAGLQKYDVITSVDGVSPASPSHVRAAIRQKKTGEEVRLGVVRAGKPLEVVVAIQAD